LPFPGHRLIEEALLLHRKSLARRCRQFHFKTIGVGGGFERLLVDLFLQSLNWPFGSACAVALVAIMVGTISLYLKVTRAEGQRDVSLM